MGGALSWLRGKDEETRLKELDEKIVSQKERLKNHVDSHGQASRWLLRFFVPLQVLLIAWFYFRARPEEVLLRVRDTLIAFVVWPVFCFVVKRVVDWYYHARVRRDQAHLRSLFDQQIKSLKAIEEDPEFKRKLELLQQFGRNVAYNPPQTPVIREIPPAQSKPVATATAAVQRHPAAKEVGLKETASAPALASSAPAPPATASATAAVVAEKSSGDKTPKKSSDSALPAVIVAPPKTYTQPVEKKRPQPPVLNPSELAKAAASGEGGFFQSLISFVVGDAPSVGEILVCSKCQANNGVVDKGSVPDVWVCKVCDTEHKKAV